MQKQGKLNLGMSLRKRQSKQLYIVTVDAPDFPLDDQNVSLTHSLNEYVGVTSFTEKETGKGGKDDDEQDYFEDTQLLGK